MVCSSVNLLFFMSVILHGDGLHKLYVGTVSGGGGHKLANPPRHTKDPSQRLAFLPHTAPLQHQPLARFKQKFGGVS